MKAFIARRVAQALLTLIIVSMVVFLVVRLTGDPVLVLAPEEATREQIEAIRRSAGLDRPVPVQYWIFITDAVQGDFGRAQGYGGEPVASLIATRWPASAELGLVALLITFGVGIPVGVYAAVRQGSSTDLLARSGAVLGQAMPPFWQGVILIMFFAVQWRLLPAGVRGSPMHLVLPAITLGTGLVAGVMRLTRSAMLEVLRSDYIMMARINGLSERQIIWKYALRNALISVLSFGGLITVSVLTGTVVVETVFAWPGLGRLAVAGISARDFPLVQGIVLAFTAFYLLVNLCVDVLYAYANPRIRY